MKLHRAYVVLTVLWFTWFWNMSCMNMIVALVPAMKEALSLSTSAASLFLGVHNLGSTASALGSGFLCARLGRRKVILLGISIALLSLLLMSLSTDFYVLVLLRVVLGLGLGVYLPAGLSILSDLFRQAQRGRYVGIHEMAAPAGMTFGPLFASLTLSVGLTWANSLQIWLIPTLLILGSQLLFVREPGETPSQPVNVVEKPVPSSTPRTWPLKYLLLLMVAQILRMVPAAEISMLPMYWVSEFGIAVGTGAFVYGLMRVFSIFGQLGSGYLSDLFGRLRVLVVIQLMGSLLLIPSSYLPFGPVLFASLSAYSVFSTGYMPVLFAFISDTTPPRERAKMIGLIMASGSISGAFNPSILGLLADTFSFRVAWLFPIAAAFLSVLVLLVLSAKRRTLAQPTPTA